MNTLYIFILGVITLSVSSLSNSIRDISTTDPAYSYVKYAVDKGYLSLFQNNNFQGSASINRKEMAFILRKLNQENLNFKLNSSDINTLLDFSNRVTDHMKILTKENDQMKKQFIKLEEENKVLHKDISYLYDSNKELIKKHKHQQLFIYGICFLSVLNLASK